MVFGVGPALVNDLRSAAEHKKFGGQKNDVVFDKFWKYYYSNLLGKYGCYECIPNVVGE